MSEETFPGLTAEDLALASLAVHALRKAVEAKVENEREPLPLMYNAIGAALYGALSKGNMGITASRISTGWLKTLEDTLDLMSADFPGWFQLAFEQRLKSNFAAVLGDSHLVSMGDMVDYDPAQKMTEVVGEEGAGKTELVSGTLQGPDEYARSTDTFHNRACRDTCDGCGAKCPGDPDCIGVDTAGIGEDYKGALCHTCRLQQEARFDMALGLDGPLEAIAVGDSAGVRAEVEAAEEAGIAVKKPRRKKTRRTKKAKS